MGADNTFGETNFNPQEKMEWISVKERMPDRAYNVIVCIQDNSSGNRHVGEGYYSHTSREWVLGDIVVSFYYQTLTHWMPLPKPPKGH